MTKEKALDIKNTVKNRYKKCKSLERERKTKQLETDDVYAAALQIGHEYTIALP